MTVCPGLNKPSFSDRMPAASGRLSYLLVVVVGLIISGLMLTDSANAQNLLTNGNFNSPNSTAAPTGWTISTYAVTLGNAWANHANDSYSFDGSYYMQVGSDENGTSGASLSQTVPGVPGYAYTLSVESGVQAWWLPEGEERIYFLDSSSNVLDEAFLDVAANLVIMGGGLPWSNYTLTANSPPNTAYVKVELASQSGTGTVFFDNANLTSSPSTTTNLTLAPVRIMPLGDSITWGQTASTNTPGGYRLPLYQLLTSDGYNVQFVGTLSANGAPNLPQPDHEGWQGYRIDQIASGFLAWINAVPTPDVILLLIGTNDYGQNYNTSTATNRLNQLITLIATNQPNAKLVVANVLLRTDSASVNSAIQTTFNPYIPGIVAAHAALGQQVYFINMYSALGSSDLGSDGLHPNQTGYNKMGTNWFNTVINLITPLGTTNPPSIWTVVGSPSLTKVDVTFSKPVSPSSATNVANYSLNGGLTILSATLDPVGQRDVSLITSPQSPGYLYTLTISNVQDATSSALTIAPGTTATFRASPPNANPPAISNIYPNGGALFQWTNTLSFTVSSANGVATSNITVTLDGANASGLVFSGSATSWNVSYPGLPGNTSHTALIAATDIYGNYTSATVSFDTFKPTNYTWEAEDYDCNGGQYFDNPQVDAYTNLSAIAGVDFKDVNLGGTYLYRPSGTATEITADLPRSQFAGKYDYDIGFFGVGEWGNYTRHYPAGTYSVWGRFAAGGGNTTCFLDQVTNGFGTTSQATNFLGTFNIANTSWTSFIWVPLENTNGNLVNITFNGSANTLRLARPDPSTGLPDVNVNFLMLVPLMTGPVTITATIGVGNITLSFPTQTGFNYQVQYKNNLTDTVWSPLGSFVSGNNAVQSVGDTVGAGGCFYRVVIQ